MLTPKAVGAANTKQAAWRAAATILRHTRYRILLRKARGWVGALQAACQRQMLQQAADQARSDCELKLYPSLLDADDDNED